jgi:hypothetical protein
MNSTPTPRADLIAVIKQLQAQVDTLTESNCRLAGHNSKLRNHVAYLEGVTYAPNGRLYRDLAAVVQDGAGR